MTPNDPTPDEQLDPATLAELRRLARSRPQSGRGQDGDGKAVRHYSVKPFRTADDDRVPPFPDRVPETVSGTASPRPLPYGGRGHGRGTDEHDHNGNRVPLEDDDIQARLDDLATRHSEAA